MTIPPAGCVVNGLASVDVVTDRAKRHGQAHMHGSWHEEGERGGSPLLSRWREEEIRAQGRKTGAPGESGKNNDR